jgi:hypothetical protein
MDLTKTFSAAEFSRALESWSWLDLQSAVPRFTSLFGDVFMECSDGSWWLLDTIQGTVTREWADGAELADRLRTESGQDRYLLGPLAEAAHRRGVGLEADQVYVFVPPPVLGGGFAVESIEALSFVVAVDSPANGIVSSARRARALGSPESGSSTTRQRRPPEVNGSRTRTMVIGQGRQRPHCPAVLV